MYSNSSNPPPNFFNNYNNSTGNPANIKKPYSTGTGTSTTIHNNTFNRYIRGSSTDSIQYISYEDFINIVITKDGKKHTVIENNDLKLNETDNIDICEVRNVFEYMKNEYPAMYADLILKGIIK